MTIVAMAWLLVGCSDQAQVNVEACEAWVTDLCGSATVPEWPFDGIFANCTVFGSDPFLACDMQPFYDCMAGAVTTCDNPDDWPYTRDTAVYDAAETCAAELSCGKAVQDFFVHVDEGYYEDCACASGEACVLDDPESTGGVVGGTGTYEAGCTPLPAECDAAATSCAADGTLGDTGTCPEAACGRVADGMTIECVEGELHFVCSG